MSMLFPEAFLAQAQDSRAIAVVDANGDERTYGELERKSRRLAGRLRALGADPETRIGILLERSFERVVSVVAVLRSGAAYVPLDVGHPPARWRALARDAGLVAVISHHQDPDLGCQIVRVDGSSASGLDGTPERQIRAKSAAYVIYTSGSTGRPKGVVVEHRSLAWLLRGARRSYGLSSDDRVLQFSSLSFDLSVLEILPTLACGGTVVLRDDAMTASIDEFFRRCRRLGVTVFFPPTSFWHEMADAVTGRREGSRKRLPSSLRLVGFGTERVDPRRVGAWRRRIHGPRLVNAYGATETTVDATLWDASAVEARDVDGLERVPIGRPVPGVDVKIRAGELVVSGAGLARGYLDAPGRTARAFVPDPEAVKPGRRRYRTGDRGRLRADGQLEVLGRLDQQVKIRGFRIEPGEVEEALNQHPTVQQAAVVFRDEADPPFLAAFVVTVSGQTVTSEAMRRHLEARLPNHMVPAVLVPVERLPLTVNHKVDRQALRRIQLPRAPVPEPPENATRSTTEAALARIWADVLGRGDVGPHDDFFALGGDSILSLRIAARAHEAGFSLDSQHVFKHPTIAGLARHVARRGVELNRSAAAPPSGAVALTPIQHWFFELDPAEPWHFNQTLMLELRRAIASAVVRRAIEALLEHHDALRLRFVRQDGRWHQRYEARPAPLPFHHLDVSRVKPNSSAQRLAAESVQTSLNLAAGPLLRAAYFDFGDGRPARLLLAIHHLAVDTVSWHILLADLERLCEQLTAGRPASLPPRTTSYQEWAERVAEEARSKDVRGELAYFQNLPSSWPALPLDRAGEANLRATADTVSTILDAERTDDLLQRVAAAYGIRIHEVLLWAVARAVARWTEEPRVWIEVESHGRESVFEGVDLSRTVGWFTTSYPLLLELPSNEAPEALWSVVREQLRAVPRHGFFFFARRYLGTEETRSARRQLPSPEIHFNYLGRLDAMATPSFALSSDEPGRRRSRRGRRPALFEVEGAVVDGRLEVHWCYSRAHHRPSTVERLASHCVEELERLISTCVAATGGEDREVEDVYPLTPVQEGLLFHALYAPESAVYHEQYDWQLAAGDQAFDAQAFRQAWQALVARHAVLRTELAWRDLPRPVQIVRRRAELDWQRIDLEALEPADRTRAADQLAAADRRRGFDLETAPLMRCLLVSLGGGRFRFVWSLHHLLLDGWSVGLVLDELFELYAGHRQPRSRPFRDYVSWLDRQGRPSAERFWRRQLAGRVEPTSLAMAEPSAPDGAAYQRHGEVERHLSPQLTARLDDFVRRRQLTWGTLLAGAWAVVLARTSGRPDVVFGSTASGRPPSLEGSESMVGLLIQTLPLRVTVAACAPLLTWLEALRDLTLELRDHGYASLSDLRAWSGLPGDRELFESMLGFHNFPGEATLAERRGTLRMGRLRYFSQTHYPLTLLATLESSGLRMQASYDSARFSRSVVARTLGQLIHVLQGFLKVRDLRDLTLLSRAQRHQLVCEWNATGDGGRERHPVELFEAQVTRTPESVAVVEASDCGLDDGPDRGSTVTWTYRALDRQATVLGHRLRALGVGPERVVGVLIQRSFLRTVAMLGVWKAGGAFLLLEPTDPAERRRFLLADSGAVGLVAGDELDLPSSGGFGVRLDAPHPNPLPVVSAGAEMREPAGERGPEDGPVPVAANAAYVVYTSGSTGRPKGTVVSGSALAAYLEALRQHCPLDGQDRMLVRIPASFDAGLIEIFPPLVSGAQQVLAPVSSGRDPELLVDLIRRQSVTATTTVPSVLRMLLAELDGETCPSLRFAICGGEVLHRDDWQAFIRAFPRAVLWNAYGPTEATIEVTTSRGRETASARLPIGRPFAGSRIRLLDRRGEVAVPGVPGMLGIGGHQLARGYLQQPCRTAECFVPDPQAPTPGERLYRSGDLARLLADGVLDFLGRVDDQVKVRGVRVELGEIEAVLAEHPAVRQAAVMARSAAGEVRLTAFVVPEPPAGPELEAELREHVVTLLPEVMRPSSFAVQSALPLLAGSSKVDRAALAQSVEAAYESPSNEGFRGPIEAELAEIWCQLLGLRQPPDRHQNLFELGAHSLIITQAASRIRRRFGVELSLRGIFDAPTVARIAARIEAAEASEITVTSDLGGEARCVAEWKTLGEALHSDCEAGDTHGWTSSYTGQAIPEEEMREWLASTVLRIRELAPRRVLEIGCGTGLVLFEIAPESERYVGLELSAVGAEKVADAAEQRGLAQVSVRCQEADDFTDIPRGTFDTVVINSVIQYFPSVAYLLRVLRGATCATAPGGRIFVGDVRDLRLHELFCASVERFRAGRETSGGSAFQRDLRRRIQRRRERDKELLIDPAFFHALQRELPRISRVILRPKGGQADNEMTRFRYDVVLELDGKSQADDGELLTLTWPAEVSSLVELRRLLERQRERVRQVCVRGFRDRHLMPDLGFLTGLEEAAETTSCAELAKDGRRGREDSGREDSNAVAPADLLALGRKLGYAVELAGPPFPAAGAFDLVFRPEGRAPFQSVDIVERPWRSYANAPWVRAAVEMGGVPADPALAAPPPLERRPASAQPIALSFAQQRVWFVEQLAPGRSTLNMVEAWQIRGTLDTSALAAAWREIERRHEVLRSRFPSTDGRPRQEIAPAAAVDLPFIDLTALPEDQRLALAVALAHEDLKRSLDLARGPLARLRLVQLGERHHVFWKTLHHIVSDGWSEAILARELETLYGAGLAPSRRSPLPEPSLQYADFAHWQRDWLRGEILERHLAYWRQELAGLEPLELPTDRPRLFRRSERGSTCPFTLPASLIDPLKGLAESRRASLFMGLLAVFLSLLRFLTGRRDVAVASPVANRRGPEAEEIVGFFVNTLILRARFLSKGERGRAASEPRFVEVLDQVRRTTLAAYDHQDLPFERLVEALQPAREVDHQPLFRVVFALHNTPNPDLRLPGLELTRLDLKEEPLTCDLEWHGWERQMSGQEAGLEGYWVYDGTIFDPERIERLVAHFERLLTAIVADPERLLEVDAWLSPTEAEQLRAERPTPVPDRPLLRRMPSAASALPPRSELEADLLLIWSETLEIRGIGIDDNFFDLGGHSLVATRVRSRIQQRLGRRIRLRWLFEFPTVATLAAHLESVATATEAKAALRPSIRRRARGEPAREVESAPTSFAQERLWFLDQLFPGRATYNMPRAWRLLGDVDRAALRVAWGEIVRRHEVLRTTFPSPGGQPRQAVERASWSSWLEVDLTRLQASDRGTEGQRCLNQEAKRPFDLSRGPLLRVFFLLLEAGREAWMLRTTHHIASDGWSEALLDRELSRLYRALTGRMAQQVVSPLSELAVQYSDYASWQRRWLSGNVLDRQLDFWRQRLDGLEPLRLPTDRRRPTTVDSRGAVRSLRLAPSVVEALGGVHRRAGTSLFMLLVVALRILLHRWTGQRSVAIGSPSANRSQREVEDLVGFFVNLLVLRGDVEPRMAFRVLLRRVRQEVLEAQAHQDLPFEKLVEALRPDRDPGRNPLVQVSLALAAFRSPAVVGTEPVGERTDGLLPGIEATDLELDFHPTRFDLSLHLTPGPGLHGWWLYRPALFDATSVERLGRHFVTLLTGIAETSDVDSTQVADLPWLRPTERHQLCSEWGAVATVEVGDICAHELFEAQAARSPDAVALMWRDGERERQMSYRLLEISSERLARRLRSFGVGPEGIVALWGQRRPEMVIGLLAVLKAGAAYLPLDPDLPAERLTFLLEDSRPSVVLARSAEIHELDAGEIPVLELDSDRQPGFLLELGERGQRRDSPSSPSQLAYLLYTSGSTGRPKGVAVEHRQLVSYVRSLSAQMALEPGWTYALALPLSVDSSVTALWPPLLTGGCLLLVSETAAIDPQALGRLAAARPIDVLKIAPSHFAALVEPERSLPFAVRRRLIFGGEALRSSSAAGWWTAMRRAAPDGQIHNHYGPTEATVGVFSHRLRDPEHDTEADTIPIGRPFVDTVAQVAGKHLIGDILELVPAGIVGELWVGGAGLARGYLRRPGRTAVSFRPDPWSPRPGARLYRTGDRVRQLAGGEVEFQGRRDHQVRVRGRRVELGEIESVLTEHPAVREAVVQLVETTLIADVEFVGQARPSVAELRRWLGARLPDYMVPEALAIHRHLPRTANGKVDRRALAMRSARIEEEASDRATAAPLTATEATLLGIWERVLGRSGFGVHDNFFELGGHSLLATRILSRVRSVFRVELGVYPLFEKPTVAELALEVAAAPAVATLPLTRTDRPVRLPLSFAQQRLWFLQWLAPESAAYNVPYSWEIEGPLDVCALERAISTLVRRHETLRTTFPSADGRPAQRIAPPTRRWLLPMVELGQRFQEHWPRLLTTEAPRPYDLTRESVIRAFLVRLDATHHVLFLNLHHIASDGGSRSVLYRELAAAYRGESLPELPIQYADYALWQRRWLASEALEARLKYWRRQLAGLAPLALPIDRPRPEVVSFRGASLAWRLDSRISDRLRSWSTHRGASLYMTLLAAYGVVLQRWSGQRDVAIGSPIAGRGAQELEGLIGFFVNMLVMRLDLGNRPRFGELLRRARDTALAAYAHQDLPFERLVDELAARRDTGQHPLFQVALAVQDTRGVELCLSGLEVREPEIATRVARFDLELFVAEVDGELSASLVYSTDLFDVTTVARFAGQLTRLLKGLAEDPQIEDRPVAELPILTSAEEHQLRIEWNDSARALPAPSSLQGLFEAQVRQTPESLVTCAGDALSYRQLDRRADRVAARLRALGVGPEIFVGLFWERSFDLLAALLGVLKAGGALVPLDPRWPRRRLEFVIRDSILHVILSPSRLRERLLSIGPEVIEVEKVVDDPVDDRLDSGAAGRSLAAGLDPRNPAYLTYTSGSTGGPKGVVTSHRSAVAHLAGWQRALALDERDRVLHKTPLGFDVAIWEIFSALVAGARLVLAASGSERDPADLIDTAIREGATTLHFVPSMLPAFLDLPDLGRCRTLRFAYCGGETLPADSARRLQRRLPEAAVLNLYGPTETTITATTWRFREVGEGAPPIGHVVSNTRSFLFDKHLRSVPRGSVGEILLGGVQIARAYHQRQGLTAESFIPDPVGRKPGERLYKTGDLGRLRADGSLDFLGRLDHQVQVRGVRVELGEIEAALLRHSAVWAAAVVERESEDLRGSTLAAYVAVDFGARGDSDLPQELRAFLRQSLPDVMVPKSVVVLDELPLLTHGKVDRAALEKIDPSVAIVASTGSKREGRPGAAPRTSAEKTITAIWLRFLEVETIGVQDNFFDLGGDSILSIRIVAEVNHGFETHGLRLTAKDFFRHQTVAELAKVAASGRGPARSIAQEPEPGPVPLIPVQLDFFERAGEEPWHFNQAHLLRTKALEPAALKAAVARLLQRHDALRLRYTREGDDWRQTLVPFDGRVPVHQVDFSARRTAPSEREVTEICTQWHRSLDLASGPMLRFGCLRCTSHDLVLITIHHLAVDRVSWSILLEDLDRAYRGLRLLPATSPFTKWAQRLPTFARSERLRRELAHWRQVASETTSLPVDSEGPNTLASIGELKLSLDPTETRRLKAGPTLERLLWALVRAFADWTSRPQLFVELEGHGREEIFDDIDLSRTVGWFTSLYPAFLSLAGLTNEDEQLDAIGEQLRAVPGRGLGYGILRYLNPETEATLRELPRPEVLFNYLGTLESPPGSRFTSAEESFGAVRSSRGPRVHLLEVTAAILEGRFQMSWRYSRSIHRPATIERLSQGFLHYLRCLLGSKSVPRT